MKKGIGLVMVAAGVLLLAAVGAFVSVALGYRHSFTSSDVPIGDFLEGLLLLSPAWLFAGALIFFGYRFVRSARNG
jgi:hypothetical protein